MSESFFFIQNHRFLLPDLEHMDSQEIHISSVPRPYNAIFHTSGHSTFSWIEPLLASAAHPLLFIDRRLRNSVLGSLSISGIPCMEFDAIEEHKSIESVLKLCDFLLTGNANRGSMLFVIGGGITQDVAATASALYKRGLPWTLIPTTLLSQADSCIGSKTCLNYGHAKNLLGLFCAPRQVHIDPAFTRTLPRDDTAHPCLA